MGFALSGFMPIAELITAFATLFVVIDPIGLMPLFVALTAGMTPAQRRAIALRSCIVAAGLLTLFGLLGDAVLDFIGISMPAFRIAGGILLFLTALDMLFERRTARRKGQAEDDGPGEDPSVFPLAMPLIAGPGAMATMILLAGAPETSWTDSLAIPEVIQPPPSPMHISYRSAPRIVAALATLMLVPGLAAQDQLTFTTGVTLQGEVKGLNRGTLDFDTEEMDVVPADWELVDAVSSAAQFEVTTVDGDVYFGSLGGSGRTLTVTGPSGTANLPFEDVVEILSISSGFIARTSGYLDVTANLARANSLYSLLAKGRAAYNGRKWGKLLTPSTQIL